MKTNKISLRQNKIRYFLVLIPHRDSLVIPREIRRKLFEAGFPGAYSFPLAVPLAGLSEPLNREELKHAAGSIRNVTIAKQGWITAGNPGLLQTQDFSFFGPVLDLPLADAVPFSGNRKILHSFQKAVLCTAISAIPAAVEYEPFSFRAAIVTNLAILPLDSGAHLYSYKWRLGPEHWLPSFKGK